MKSFPEVWAVPPMNPNFFSSSKSITQLNRRQPLRGCRSTSFRFGSCPFWRAREWEVWPTCHECAKGIWSRSHAVLWSGSFHSSPNETAKLLTTLARFQGLTSIRLPSRLSAKKKWTDIAAHEHLFWNSLFSPRVISAQSSKRSKKFDLAAAFATQTNPKLSLDPGLFPL